MWLLLLGRFDSAAAGRSKININLGLTSLEATTKPLSIVNRRGVLQYYSLAAGLILLIEKPHNSTFSTLQTSNQADLVGVRI